MCICVCLCIKKKRNFHDPYLKDLVCDTQKSNHYLMVIILNCRGLRVKFFHAIKF